MSEGLFEPRPTHVVARPGDDVTICGLHWRRDGTRAYPQMAAMWVDKRLASYEERGLVLILCETCEAGRRA